MQTARQQNITPQQALNKARQFSDAGNLAKAENVCRRIINLHPRFHPAYFQLGMIATKVGKLPIAANVILQAVQIDPKNYIYHRAAGEIFRRLRQIDKAIEHGQEAVKLAPHDAESFYNLGVALSDAGRLKEAAQAYQFALQNKPDYDVAANNLGTVLERLQDENGAIEAYRKATECNPVNAEAQNNLGAILSMCGKLDEAVVCFNAAIDADPGFIFAHYNLSALKRYEEDDPHLGILENFLMQAPRMPADTRTRFWFAIGKAREDVGRYDEAFDAYRRGNAIKRSGIKFNITRIEAFAADTISKFDRAFAQKKIVGFADETPVFIVGMPRSGTTLIEQIISSHSKVHGAGELKDFCDVINSVRGRDAGPYMDWLLKADDSVLTDAGRVYVQRLRTLDNSALRITDKMPGNFFYVGLIHKVLPKAKIIFSVRDPMDICVSNYTRLFNETMPFAYDLAELGRYNNVCNAMMAHWQAVLPAETIFVSRYEDNVADLEGQARKLIEFIGLEWEDGCLDFHKNARNVKTASIAQVRKPIYKSSVARWKRFERHLKPLQQIIEEKT